jgi:hypothetical protein
VFIDNQTPFSVATILWENQQGQPQLSIIVKSTFSFTNGHVTVAPEQLPVFTSDELQGEGPTQSTRFESDMAPFKPKADVVLVGKAHAPRGLPVTQLDVTLHVGHLAKTIRVFGDRTWRFPSKLVFFPFISTPKPFTSMDLTYDRAFGGIDSAAAWYCKENLIGQGFIGKKSRRSLHLRPLPNLEDPQHLIRWWRTRPKPVGFGFYGRSWLPRSKYVGTQDEHYQKNPSLAVPRDFSYAFYNGAHPDLQVTGYLRGDEDVELTHVTPEPTVRFRLPGIRPRVIVSRCSVPPEEWLEQNATEDRDVSLADVPTVGQELDPVLDTLVFIPDQGIFYEVFRGVYSLTSLDSTEIARISISL